MSYRGLSKHLLSLLLPLLLLIVPIHTNAQETIQDSNAYAVLESTEQSILDTQDKLTQAKKELAVADTDETKLLLKSASTSFKQDSHNLAPSLKSMLSAVLIFNTSKKKRTLLTSTMIGKQSFFKSSNRYLRKYSA